VDRVDNPGSLEHRRGRAILPGTNLAKRVKREFTLKHIHFTADREFKLEKLLTDEEVFSMLENICDIVQSSWGLVRWLGREIEINVTHTFHYR
jgi:hypothetical protein